MATKEQHAPQADQAPAWPGPAKDPAWVGPAPEPAQAGRAHEPAWSSRAPDPAQAGRTLRAGGARGPLWRTLLEAQWRDQVQEVTELSLAYHEAASAAAAAPPEAPAGAAPPGELKVRKLLRRTVAARRALADTEEALGRLASGRYGLCEGCAAAIPARLLAAAPDARYCSRCRPRPVRAPGPAMAVRPALRGG
jgi:RNA polymerase-binding transcription factor DksA